MNISDILTDIKWQMRTSIKWSAPVIKSSVKNPSRIHDALTPDEQARVTELSTTYSLEHWAQVCTQQEYKENLYLLDICDRYIGRNKKYSDCLDIGCKNWSYLPALTSFTQTPWDGVELDAYRRYLTLVTRKAYAEDMIRIKPGCRYIAGSFLDVQQHYSLITWFLPFVTEGPLHTWGLPGRYFDPAGLLTHAWGLLSPGATMFIVNQGEHESQIQLSLFRQLNIPATSCGEIHSVFNPYTQPRFGWLIHK